MDTVAEGLLVIGTIGMATFLLQFAFFAGRLYPSGARLPAVIAAAAVTLSSIFQGLHDFDLIALTPLYAVLVVCPLAVAIVAMWKLRTIVRAGMEQPKKQT